MTAALETKNIDCPHCKGKIEVEIERKPAKVHIEKTDEPALAVSELDAAVERVIEKRKTKEPEEKKEKSTLKIPTHVKKYKCKSCGKLHENKEFEGKPKGQCDNCGAFFTNRSSGKCPYCKPGEIGELDDEAIEKMELYEDEEDEHDHE